MFAECGEGVGEARGASRGRDQRSKAAASGSVEPPVSAGIGESRTLTYACVNQPIACQDVVFSLNTRTCLLLTLFSPYAWSGTVN